MISTRTKEKSGITLLALVVTIIVLLILSGVTISAINSNNGVLTQTKRATITSDLSKYKEEVELYKASKQMEGTGKKTADGKRFEATSLNANYQEKSLVYNTQDGNETGDITTIIPDLKKDYHDGKRDNGEISVTNGQMVFKSTNDELYKIAQDLGIEVDPYNVKIEKDSNGKDVAVLTSSDKNLLLMSEDGTVTLPYDIEVIDSGTFSGVKGLKKIIIPYTVKQIRPNAFSYNSEIQEVVFQTKNDSNGNIEGCTTIGNDAFRNCIALSKLTLPGSLLSLGYRSFDFCQIKELKIPDNVAAIPTYCFRSNPITKIEFGRNLTSLDAGSFEATKIQNIIIPSKVNNIANLAFNNSALTDVTIESRNIIISSIAFNNCPITKFTIADGGSLKWNKEKNTVMNNNGNVAFIYPSYLKQLSDTTHTYEIPEGATYWDYSMYQYNINKLIVPSSLTGIYIPWLPKLTDIDISKNNNFKILYDKNNNKMLCDTNNKLCLFLSNNDIDIEIPNTIKEILGYSLSQILKVQNLTINVEKIDSNVFYSSHPSLKKITLGANVTDVSPIFYTEKYNDSITINVDPKNNKYFVYNGMLFNKILDGNNWKECRLVRSYIRPATKTENTTLDIPKEISDRPVTTIGNYALYDQNTIEKIIIDDNIKTIEDYVFYNCTNLKNITIPSSVKSIGASCFMLCQNLNSINMGVTQNEANTNGPTGAPWGATKGERVVKWASQ